jgi:delta 1-pyrroline-5-carboxylate dehydrogenase
MEYKRVTLAIVAVALMMAGGLATLKDKKILGAQYQRYAFLVQQADRLFLGKNYDAAAANYRDALKIDPGDAGIWAKFQKSERAAILSQVQTGLPDIAPQKLSPVPRPQPQGGMIIEEDEGC